MSLIPTVLVLASVVVQAVATAPQPAVPAIAKAQTALAAIVAGDGSPVEAQFTDAMKAAMPAGRLVATWKALQFRSGVHKTCETTSRVVAVGDKTMVITACEFARATIDVQFAFDAEGRISGLVFRPAAYAPGSYVLPAYANAATFTETAVTVGAGEWILPGTLTMPVGSSRVPAVVLVHGSGPGNRDAAVGANAPFRDLAVGLASRGIAVLRYDKRTLVHGGKVGALPHFTVQEESIDDALGAVKVLRVHPQVDADRVYVLGHSLGGMLIPRIGKADPSLAGLIVMAGAAQTIEDAVRMQARYLAGADGTISAEEQRGISGADALAATVRGLTAADVTQPGLIFGAPASYWLDLRGYDPPAAAVDLKTPMLILQGERDYQVTMDDFAKWKSALGSRSDVTFHVYPALNHLFVAGTGPSLPAEYLVAGHVAEDVIRDIATWVLRRR